MRYLDLTHVYARDDNSFHSSVRPAPEKMILTIDTCTAAVYVFTLILCDLSLTIKY